MSKWFVPVLVVSACTTIAGHALASDIDPLRKLAWAENIGWTNWKHDTPKPGDGVTVGDSFLAGFIWAENVGWINLGDGIPGDGVHYANIDASDYGVNLDPSTGDLFGLAWGENVGWINFDTTPVGDDRARFSACDHRFFGYAWGENIGWINLDDATHFVAVGPCAAGDLDCDGEVTLDDFMGFATSMSGPDGTTACSAYDADDDSDVDLADYAEVQRAFTAIP